MPAERIELAAWLPQVVERIAAWESSFGPVDPHPATAVDAGALHAAVDELADRLQRNYPYFHPRYAAQMLKPPHPAAVLGYVAAMLVNPNNHALDGGPATAGMEQEVTAALAAMFGFGSHLGHLTSSGTIANLEALFVARQSHPGRGVAYSEDAHYTHARMADLLGVAGRAVPADAAGRMDLDALEALLRRGEVGTVVLTAGTTGLGAIDPIAAALALRERYGVRLHVDAAYGGFFRLIADGTGAGVAAEDLAAIASCDSVVVDPHKHGLQPYGCGAVLFADPAVGRFYRHDSPYTYFTSGELHLGEISLECSRAGAAAAALWLTLRLLPLTADGLGRVLRPGRRAALAWSALLAESEVLAPYQAPDLDIVTYLARAPTLSGVDAASARVLADGEPPGDGGGRDPGAVWVATYTATAAQILRRGHRVEADLPAARILRSVLMKPESEAWVGRIHERVSALAGATPAGPPGA